MSYKSHKKPPDTRDEIGAVEDTAKSGEETTSMPDPAGVTADDASAADPDSPAPAQAEQKSPVAILEGQLDEARNRHLRAQAELENFRKRMLRTVEDERRYASLPLMRDLLPVVDNLQRAIQAAEQHEHATALLEGVKLVASQLDTVLQRHHCAPIVAHGAAFDPHLHEAIAQHPSADHEPGHVCLVAQAGYQLHDRVIRPAQVIVAAPRDAVMDTPEEPGHSGT
jgi:molecular chaperone GrpE